MSSAVLARTNSGLSLLRLRLLFLLQAPAVRVEPDFLERLREIIPVHELHQRDGVGVLFQGEAGGVIRREYRQGSADRVSFVQGQFHARSV